jgi:hypothetical protein
MKDYSKEGIPLGDYDPYSIMHYLADENMRPLDKISGKIGQRKDFSEGDLAAIRHVYSNNRCTYDSFKDEYYVQTNFECLTCWGPDSVYGVCVYCRYVCHKGHRFFEHRFEDLAKENVKFVCDCGRNEHSLDVCTRVSTKERSVQQMLYRCHDCHSAQDSAKKIGICHPCSRKCHKGHIIEAIGDSNARCDCVQVGCRGVLEN